MATYYVDFTNGNDSWDGLAPAYVSGTNGPWKTVTKVNGFSFAAGDFCLFKCGESWPTQLRPATSGVLNNHIIFGTYNKGLGAKAKLTAGIDANNQSYLTFNGLHVSGARIWADGGESYLYFQYCTLENMGTSFGFCGGVAQTDIRFDNCVFCRNLRYHIYTVGVTTVRARNCLFLTNSSTDEGPWLIGAGGNLDLDYCFINTAQIPSTANVTDGGHNIWYTMPKITAYPPTPAVTPKFVWTFDDNYIDEFETMVSGVFATYGIKATLFVNPGTLTEAQKTKCAAFVTAGHEVANHGWCHEDLTATQAFQVTSTNMNPTVDVDVPTKTITLWCDEVANRITFNWDPNKTIQDLKNAVAGKGWTITNSVEGGKTRQNALKLDCLADSAGPQACPYTTLLDIAAPNYKFWDHEINDAQDSIQTITGVRPITFAYPYGYDNANLITWIKANTTLKSCRDVGGATTNLSSVPIWKFIQRPHWWTTASTEATVREWARRHWLYNRCVPAYHLYYEHQTAAAFWTRLGWMINEIQSLDGEFCTYAELVTWIESDHTVSGDNWIKTYDVTGADYHLLSGSPCIDAGIGISLYEDADGNPVPWNLIPDMGVFEYFPFPDEEDVRLGVSYGSGLTGGLDLPAEGDVEAGVSFDSATKTGTFVSPIENDVRDGIPYGNAGEFNGDLVSPAQGDVKAGIGYGADGTEFVGTLVPAVNLITELHGELQRIQGLTGVINNE